MELTDKPSTPSQRQWYSGLVRRYKEFSLLSRDPVLFMSLLLAVIFLFVFIFYPLIEATYTGFIDKSGNLDLQYFARYFDDFYGPLSRQIFRDTLIMGLLTATGGTILGFLFAFAVVRCNIPGKRFVHLLALVPTVSPPFAIALSTILLLGRSGLITKGLLGIQFQPGMNDIYGMDGLVFVQIITFFSASYLILRAMLERVDASMEEAAESLGAGRFHLFRTVTLPLLIPGIAGAFLLLFVESLADLGNPLFISGNVTVLSAQIFLAVIGEFDYQKASALAVVLLLPTLIVFILQRYYVNRRSYISVTGKPTGGRITEKDGRIRFVVNGLVYITCAVIVILYTTIIYGSFSTAWGVDFSPSLRWWELMLTRGVEAILDTTFLSAFATPLAALLGMVIAFLVVRKKFSGKEMLDFGSNLGGAVPGTILGIGYVLAFNSPSMITVVIVYSLVALLFTQQVGRTTRERLIILLGGTTLGLALRYLGELIITEAFYYIVTAILIIIGLFCLLALRQRMAGIGFLGLGAYLALYNLIEFVTTPIATFSRSLPPGFGSNAIFQFSDHLKVFFQPPPILMAIGLAFVSVILVSGIKGNWRVPIAVIALTAACSFNFLGTPLMLAGSPYIIILAYIVRSLPASVRAGVAALQQIDPSIEEASNILGADAQVTFRKVTLPLITPALLSGLIFSFTRHMTSLSAIIFLVTARWRIVTASILSEWEQGGVSIAAAYSTVIIVFVLIAIGILYLITNKALGSQGDIDLSLGA